ncbi:hypothetical protein X777_00644, partial [Ooceraea biroi]
NNNNKFKKVIYNILNAGVKIVETASFIVTSVFNEGCNSILKIMNLLEIQIGLQTQNFSQRYDEERLARQRRRSLSTTKKARTARKASQMVQNECYEEVEGLLYGAGIAD